MLIYTIISLTMAAAAIGIISLCYTVILPLEPIGNKWYKLLQRITGGNLYLMKPLIDCSRCFAGQLALWAYLGGFLTIHRGRLYLPISTGFTLPYPRAILGTAAGMHYSLMGHVFIITAAIVFADLFTFYYAKRNKR